MSLGTTSRRALEIGGLSLASVFLVLKIVINVVVGSGIGPVKNSTAAISDIFETKVTPAGWAFAIWGVIYTWQALWIIYAWTFVCRPSVPQTIFTGVYFGYVLVCIANITWIFVWGNELVAAAAAIFIIFNAVFYPTIAMLAFFLARATSEAKPYDVWLTRILVLNGLLFYATWTTVASFINLTAALQYDADYNGSNAAYISLSLLTATVITYFILENTVFDRYLRYVFAVYPVIIWALSAVLQKKWNSDNPSGVNIFTLVLLIITVILVILRIVLFILFTMFRPLRSNYKTV